MKKSIKKSTVRGKNLEEKVDFLIDFVQTKVVTKDYLDGRLTEKADKSDIVRLTSQIDGLAKQIKDYHQEMIMFTRKVERMESWIKKVSAKVGIPYEY